MGFQASQATAIALSTTGSASPCTQFPNQSGQLAEESSQSLLHYESLIPLPTGCMRIKRLHECRVGGDNRTVTAAHQVASRLPKMFSHKEGKLWGSASRSLCKLPKFDPAKVYFTPTSDGHTSRILR